MASELAPDRLFRFDRWFRGSIPRARVTRPPRSATVSKHLHRLAAGSLPAASQPGHPSELLQHLLHLHELLQQTIHFLDRRPTASGNPLSAAAVDDVLSPPFVRR